ncbi:D-alanyl-D-alanine carboxypeptidase [Pedobacter sp. SL55]|uniref:D-alanyl-D-alanine carboxypeptidase n=1 Tax=Pedobacter sp. SL55 TaxID=2995161 RepID=UPI0022703108|nr:D-alanyl-D-alanine carboxypeptidase [Pedobacter sp. SL55]WAC41812.1 D-alanyl-D-alanine carboxypeptidase [Pedobacter sp. SL55]
MNKLKTKIIVLGAMCLVSAFYACKPNQIIAKKVAKEFKNSAMLNKYQVGFALYDMAGSEMIFQKDADKYFTPASNTKLFTFYAGLKITPDSIPSLRYIEKGDSLIFWGTKRPIVVTHRIKGNKSCRAVKKQ